MLVGRNIQKCLVLGGHFPRYNASKPQATREECAQSGVNSKSKFEQICTCRSIHYSMQKRACRFVNDVLNLPMHNLKMSESFFNGLHDHPASFLLLCKTSFDYVALSVHHFEEESSRTAMNCTNQ